ncbi:hypothetical protein NEISUBOT_04659 [Neisseria subflava NJ9703]|uniref:Uncharacterized protein n=1 Tax=Neisseria subflava NJ9703 TaxID=546268 RepID=A0A9W5MZ57_NEISU|nr:hypothetical protein NEISUBOT_04659 [Neisseria subflava NJ9703]
MVLAHWDSSRLEKLKPLSYKWNTLSAIGRLNVRRVVLKKPHHERF